MTYPNRMLREAGLLEVREEADGEHFDFAASRAWALVDHQFSHVFVQPGDEKQSTKCEAYSPAPRHRRSASRRPTRRYDLDHDRAGDVILISTPNSWQAYYWWLDDANAPAFARTVDIHRKPGYDPVELFFDPATRSIPLDATLVKGSHGAPGRKRKPTIHHPQLAPRSARKSTFARYPSVRYRPWSIRLLISVNISLSYWWLTLHRLTRELSGQGGVPCFDSQLHLRPQPYWRFC